MQSRKRDFLKYLGFHAGPNLSKMQEQNISAEELKRIETDAMRDTNHWHSQTGPHREWHNAAYIAGAVTEYLRAAKSKQPAEDLSAPASPVEGKREEFQRWQSIDINDAVRAVTEVMREADVLFEKSGGSTRHYVSELLIPMLAEKGLVICKTQPFPPSPPSPLIEIGEQPKLNVPLFSKLSAERAETGFRTYKNVPITYWTTALAGEVGELCNMIKKMERVSHGGIDGGSSYTAASLNKTDLAEEIGGIFIYLNILSGLLDIDTEDAIIETFNSKSIKYGFAQMYPPASHPSPSLIVGEREERKYPIGGYAPGNYYCNCVTCKEKFQGDKRAVQCEPCAIKMVEDSGGKDYAHIHVSLPNGATATVSPDASPELLNALTTMVDLAKAMADAPTEQTMPEEVGREIDNDGLAYAKALEETYGEYYKRLSRKPVVDYTAGAIDMYHKMQDTSLIHSLGKQNFEKAMEIKEFKATIQTYNELNARLSEELRMANALIKEKQAWIDSHM